jgi:pimeloyl-ACP methyl ester carboxylesterase
MMLGALTLSLLVGCGARSSRFTVSHRMDRGVVILLPGIEGEGPLSYAVRDGINDAGIDQGLPIYRWGRPVPLAGPLLNQMDFLGNRMAADRLVKMIVEYQDAHPGMPVHLVGHSGGGGVAVFAAEALPDDRRVDGIVLLSPSISAGYDLTAALAHTRKGIVNFWSPNDVGLLVLGTTILGNVDGGHGPAAGAMGFTSVPNGQPFDKLHQVEWSAEMTAAGNHGTHMDSAGRAFVQRYVAPWIQASTWRVGPYGGDPRLAHIH